MSIHRDAKPTAHSSYSNLTTRPVSVESSESEDEEFYKNDFPKMGRVLIFNQNECEGFSNERVGSVVDSRNLENVLKCYKFDYDIYLDYTQEEIEETLKAVAREDHSRYNCLMVLMMSHGDENKNVYTKDGPMEVDILWKYFTGDRCSSLCGKPKLFFVQACRGSSPDFGSLIEHQQEIDTARMSLQNNDEHRQTIPVMADILVMFSSAEGYPSFRDPSYGSWFIEGLCEVMKKYFRTRREKDLMTLLTEVNRYVAYSKEAYDPKGDSHGHKQMPVIMSMLTKKFMFNKNLMRLEMTEL